MFRFKKTLFALTGSLALVLSGCGSDDETPSQEEGAGDSDGGVEEVTIQLGHHHAVGGQVDQLAEKISELATEKSDGAITVDVFPGGQLGEEMEAIEGVNMGTMEMSIVSPGLMDQYSGVFGVETLPFIFEDWDHADESLNGEPGKALRENLLDNSDIRVMGYMHLGFRHMITNETPIESLDDINGLGMRSPESWVWTRMFELLGANPTPVTWGEAYTALQTGVVDGMESPASGIIDMNFHEVTNYLFLSNHMFGTISVVINDPLFSGLSEQQQALLTDAVEEAVDYLNENVTKPADEEAIIVLEEEKGMTVIENHDIDHWRESVEPMYDEFIERAPDAEEIIDLINELR
ncbi:TRAP transporter substrate-binding protein [Bacillus shivajii]|uniref:TRAP transporter substrate-binding protein n=1 Tax=Bacillus shivajii TaxID=1983719 RepID=UPI001CFC015D|nr:TRAP transporter substrate-binding protein [Bacillus shivajii]UCZ52909.1 TRAP transporter substrate-binding protein [Bacillus shivajii]